MKHLYIFLLAIFITCSAKAQVFAPIGAEWYYTNIESFFGPSQGYEKIRVVGDTVIQGKNCRVLNRILMTTWNGAYTLPNTYLHISGDTVFRMAPDTTFSVLYNFGAQPGYSWVTKEWLWSQNAGYVDITITVDSISTMQHNGHQLRQLHLSTDHNLLSFGYRGTITETLGGANYMFLEDYAMSHDDIRVNLRCYSDPVFGNYQADPSIPCTQMISATPENNPVFPHKIYPNPTAGTVNIEFPSVNHPKTLRIYDALGRQIQQHQVTASQSEILVNLPTEGLYLFLTEIQGQIVFSQKVIRE